MSDNQKQEEREDLIRFADAISRPDLKGAKRSEHPDFLIPEVNGVLGIEHTVMYVDHTTSGGSQIRRNDALFNTFRCRAVAKLQDRFPNVRLELYVERADGSNLKGKDISVAVDQLVAVLEPAFRDPPVSHSLDLWSADEASDETPMKPLADFVDLVRAYPRGDHDKLEWGGRMVGWGSKTIGPAVANHILEKDEKRKSLYVQNCSRVWLLLVATGTSAASLVDFPSFDSLEIPPNGFERIYLLERFSGVAKLLWPSGGAAG